MSRQKQSPFKKFFTSRLFLLVALFLAILTAGGFARAYYQDYKVRQEIKKLKEDIDSLEKKKFESLRFLDFVMSDRFVEEKARTELNLKKPDEQVIFIQNVSGPEPETNAQALDEEKKWEVLDNPRKWWYYFSHKP
ncbi:MAG: septum formation initiator family protein [Candidatus Magasanikbacteria bacterium]|nr:septum formation initiator family protein [Candidatus Magasanikbacteria bacterium]